MCPEGSKTQAPYFRQAFAVCGPLAWNCLPKEIRLCIEIEAFTRNLNTNLFVKSVNESTLAILFEEWITVKPPRMLSAQFVVIRKPCKPGPLPWRHNERNDASNHRHLDCLLNRLFSRISKKTSMIRMTGRFEGNSPVTGEFPKQRASKAENVSIWWRHNATGCWGRTKQRSPSLLSPGELFWQNTKDGGY